MYIPYCNNKIVKNESNTGKKKNTYEIYLPIDIRKYRENCKFGQTHY